MATEGGRRWGWTGSAREPERVSVAPGVTVVVPVWCEVLEGGGTRDAPNRLELHGVHVADTSLGAGEYALVPVAGGMIDGERCVILRGVQ